MGLEECQIRAEQRWLRDWKSGPTRIRWDSVPVQVGDQAPAVEVLNPDGAPVSMASFWGDGPAVVIFWRHFGCGCGLDRNKRLEAELQDLKQAGANVVIVGQGEPEQAAAYAEKYGVTVPIYSDPERQAFEAYGLLEGLPAQIFYDAGQELQRNDLQAGITFAAERREMGRAPVDSPWQLPGEFVVGRDGRIGLAYRYQYCEDFPDPRVITSALERVGAGSATSSPA